MTTPTNSYDISTYFKAGKTFYWAQYVDNTENGGNRNGEVDGNEISLFKNIIHHRYDGYQYDFERLDSEQSDEITLKGENYTSSKAKCLYLDSWDLGCEVSDRLAGYTSGYYTIKLIMHKLATFPVESKKADVIREFLKGYHLGGANHGLFEQLATEWGNNGVTNKEALELLKAMIDAVPERNRDSKDYQTVLNIYNEYQSKPADEKFEENSSFIKRFFGLNPLDQLDEAIKRLFEPQSK